MFSGYARRRRGIATFDSCGSSDTHFSRLTFKFLGNSSSQSTPAIPFSCIRTFALTVNGAKDWSRSNRLAIALSTFRLVGALLFMSGCCTRKVKTLNVVLFLVAMKDLVVGFHDLWAFSLEGLLLAFESHKSYVVIVSELWFTFFPGDSNFVSPIRDLQCLRYLSNCRSPAVICCSGLSMIPRDSSSQNTRRMSSGGSGLLM